VVGVNYLDGGAKLLKGLGGGGGFGCMCTQQILPVVRRGTAPQIVAAALCRSELWQHFTVLRLTRNMRVERLRGQDEAAAEHLASFANFMLAVGEGRAAPTKCSSHKVCWHPQPTHRASSQPSLGTCLTTTAMGKI
jgi:hypothetical protein